MISPPRRQKAKNRDPTGRQKSNTEKRYNYFEKINMATKSQNYDTKITAFGAKAKPNRHPSRMANAINHTKNAENIKTEHENIHTSNVGRRYRIAIRRKMHNWYDYQIVAPAIPFKIAQLQNVLQNIKTQRRTKQYKTRAKRTQKATV